MSIIKIKIMFNVKPKSMNNQTKRKFGLFWIKMLTFNSLFKC